MKITWVEIDLPDEQSLGTGAASYRRLRAALAHHDVSVIAADRPVGEVSIAMGDRVARVEGTIEWYPTPLDERSGVARSIDASVVGEYARLFRGGPVETLSYAESPRRMPPTSVQLREIERVLRRVVDRTQPDVIYLSGTHLAPIAAVSDVPVALLLSHELPSTFVWGSGGTAPTRLARLRWRAFERKWFRRADAIATLSDGESEALARHLGIRPVVITPNDDDAFEEWLERTARAAAHAGDNGASSGDDGADQVDASSASVIVCTRERPQILRESLQRLHAVVQTVPGSELLIVEQGRPFAKALCDELGVTGVTVVTDPGVGASRARNVGARRARGSVLLFTDDDCVVPLSWISDHLEAVGRSTVASFGAVTGLSRFSEHGDPTAAAERTHRRGSSPWVIGHSANMAISKDAFERVGGFDERIGPGAAGGFVCEDADLIVRLLHGGDAVRSGVGRPVQHIEWRSTKANLRNVRAYERGSGTWIGKVARENTRDAIPYLRARGRLLRDRVTRVPGITKAPFAVPLSFVDLVRGLVHGWRLGPWRPGAQPPAE